MKTYRIYRYVNMTYGQFTDVEADTPKQAEQKVQEDPELLEWENIDGIEWGDDADWEYEEPEELKLQ